MELNGLSSSEKNNNKGKGYSCQGLKSLQNLIRWRVPLGLGTISSQKIRGQALCLWGFRCDRCLLSLRKPFAPFNLSFFGCLPLRGKPKPLRVKDFEAQSVWIIGFLEDITFVSLCHRCTSWVCSVKKKFFFWEKVRTKMLYFLKWVMEKRLFFSVPLLTSLLAQGEQWQKVTRPCSCRCLRRVNCGLRVSWGSAVRCLEKAGELTATWQRRTICSFYPLRTISCIYAKVGVINLMRTIWQRVNEGSLVEEPKK